MMVIARLLLLAEILCNENFVWHVDQLRLSVAMFVFFRREDHSSAAIFTELYKQVDHVPGKKMIRFSRSSGHRSRSRNDEHGNLVNFDRAGLLVKGHTHTHTQVGDTFESLYLA